MTTAALAPSFPCHLSTQRPAAVAVTTRVSPAFLDRNIFMKKRLKLTSKMRMKNHRWIKGVMREKVTQKGNLGKNWLLLDNQSM
eukprot:14442743-Ditylum_brightwellii.AAC.1